MYETIILVLDIIALIFLLISFFFFLRMKGENHFLLFGVSLIGLFLIVLFNLLFNMDPSLITLSKIGNYFLTPIVGILFIIGVMEN